MGIAFIPASGALSVTPLRRDDGLISWLAARLAQWDSQSINVNLLLPDRSPGNLQVSHRTMSDQWFIPELHPNEGEILKG
jgi:hypothetical protein